MADMKLDEMIEYLPNASRNIKTNDEKFLFFFEPQIMDEKKFLFGLSLKTGVQIFSVILLIQAITSFFDIFKPSSFIMFFVNIVAFVIYFAAAAYAFLSTVKDNYSYARVSYLISSVLFILFAVVYVCKSVIKIIEFITPWDGDFLHLNFLVYVFGYGVLLFIILYLIYVLYHYMLELKNPNQSVQINGEEEMPINEPMKNE